MDPKAAATQSCRRATDSTSSPTGGTGESDASTFGPMMMILSDPSTALGRYAAPAEARVHQQSPDTAVEVEPASHDVLFGSCKCTRVHDATIAFRRVIKTWLEAVEAPTACETQVMAHRIMNDVLERGGRFLKQSETNAWYEMRYDKAIFLIKKRLWKGRGKMKKLRAKSVGNESAPPPIEHPPVQPPAEAPRRSSRIASSSATEQPPAQAPRRSSHIASSSATEQPPAQAPRRSPRIARRRLSAKVPHRSSSHTRRQLREEVASVPLEENPHIKSKLLPNFLRDNPQILDALVSWLDDLIENNSHHPSEPGKGLCLNVEAPYNPNHMCINVKRASYLRQYFGKTDEHPDNTDTEEYRKAYATGSGSRSVGGSPILHVIRDMDLRLQCIDKPIVAAARATFSEDEMDIDENDSVTFLGMYDKSGEGKDTEQVQLHRDNEHDNNTGAFLDGKNSQKKNTPTCILTIGDTRNLEFELHKGNKTRNNPKGYKKRGTVHIPKRYARTTVPLTHGSLFMLHPEDERSLVRPYFDACERTFWKHGKVRFGKKGLTIGLGYRQASRREKCKIATGEVVLDEAKRADAERKYKKFSQKLDKYVQDAEGKKEDEERLRGKYRQLKAAYF